MSGYSLVGLLEEFEQVTVGVGEGGYSATRVLLLRFAEDCHAAVQQLLVGRIDIRGGEIDHDAMGLISGAMDAP